MPHPLQKKAIPALFRHCRALWLLTAVFTFAAAAQDSGQAIDPALEEQASADQDAQRSQRTINDLDDEISLSTAENRLATQELGRLKIYNANLASIVADQEREKATLQRQIDEFGDVERDVVPFLFELLDALETFVAHDLPFLQSERNERLTRLRTGMDRSDLTISEKYRLIMEAYQIETSYGRNIEAYTGTLPVEGVERRVDMLRIGRVLLAYQTPDGATTGYWDRETKRWTIADSFYRREVADALRIARKQMAPRLLEIPVSAAK